MSIQQRVIKQLTDLFVLLVEHGYDQDQDGSNAALKHAEDKSHCEERPERLGYGVKHHNSSPRDDVRTEVLAQPESLGDIHGGEHPYQEAWRAWGQFQATAHGGIHHTTDIEGQCNQVVALSVDEQRIV